MLTCPCWAYVNVVALSFILCSFRACETKATGHCTATRKVDRQQAGDVALGVGHVKDSTDQSRVFQQLVTNCSGCWDRGHPASSVMLCCICENMLGDTGLGVTYRTWLCPCWQRMCLLDRWRTGLLTCHHLDSNVSNRAHVFTVWQNIACGWDDF